ncbi:hypothetical protein I79_021864 [Cricetulus griseus]|uniref:Uncharacterized protein n=1 Tax=Cricetulus griseus TaxID=10029 RepID=G3IDT0_CRIGR|nr:hypothetical protein I79_021864 [Cricetulus griseus]
MMWVSVASEMKPEGFTGFITLKAPAWTARGTQGLWSGNPIQSLLGKDFPKYR